MEKEETVKISKKTQKVLLDFVEMASGSYTSKNQPGSLFYVKADSGFMCKVFLYQNNIVVSFKGTSPILFGFNTHENSEKDHFIDSAFFTCKNTNLVRLVKQHFFEDLKNLFIRIEKEFKGSTIFLTGHSLGGTIATISASMFNYDAVVFSSPGDKFLHQQLGIKPRDDKILHIGLCNDTIFFGKCGIKSVCSFFNYELYTKCHTGVKYCLKTPGFENIFYHSCQTIKRMIKYGILYQRIDQKDCLDCV